MSDVLVPPPTPGGFLEPWRRRIRALFPDATAMTPTLKQTAIDETLQVWGLSRPPDDEEDTDARWASAQSAAGLLVMQQSTMLLPRVEKAGAHPDLLALLNETYEVNGERFKFGLATPAQIRRDVIDKLKEQRKSLSKRIREIEKVLRRCPNPDLPIIEQL
jgi:hypothetical protein